MAQLLVRNLDDRVVDALRARARAADRSLEEELRRVLTAAAEARALVAAGGILLAPDLVFAEVGNTAWKKVSRGEITAEQAALIVDALPHVYSSVLPTPSW
jgi:plasmid stability protein